MARWVIAAFLSGTVIATAATAGATKLITGKEIKNGTISQKDLSKAVRKQLRKVGPRGPQGVQGQQGLQGPKGDTGATGAPAAPEATHLIDLNGNGSFGAGHSDPSYYRDLSGVVHLSGILTAKGGGYGAGAAWVTLPEGYRPAFDLAYLAYPQPTGSFLYTVVKGETGVVTSYTSASTGDKLGLDGLSFRCAPSGVAGCP